MKKTAKKNITFSQAISEILNRMFLFVMKHTVSVVSVCLLLYAFTYLPDFRNWLEKLQSGSTQSTLDLFVILKISNGKIGIAGSV